MLKNPLAPSATSPASFTDWPVAQECAKGSASVSNSIQRETENFITSLTLDCEENPGECPAPSYSVLNYRQPAAARVAGVAMVGLPGLTASSPAW
jgi:hypothetical protein